MSKIVDRIFNTVLTANDVTAQEELGAFRFDSGKIYKYVQFTDAVDAEIGAPVLMAGTSHYVVTVDHSEAGAAAHDALVCGVAITTNTAQYYGWIQIYGVATVAVDTDHVSATTLLVHSGTDLKFAVGGQTDAIAAITLEDIDSSSTGIAMLRCM